MNLIEAITAAAIAHAPMLDESTADSIARDIVAVSADHTDASLLLATAIRESGLDDARLGDHGRSVCLMQIHVGNGATPEGWTRDDLLEDRTKCLRAGLRHIRASMWACRSMPKHDRLAAYLSGSCLVGRAESQRRIALAGRIMGELRYGHTE